MLSNRLLTIASLVPKRSKVLDIGTDHAYLPIYLSQNKICKSIIASDISQKALSSAQKNLDKYDIKDVKLILSDGLKNIKEKYDTIVLSGMGTNTIIDIISNNNLPNTIIISSNNNLAILRKYMNDIGYKITKEVISYDNKKYYDIILYNKGKEKLSKKKIKYGLSKNKDYYKYLLKKEFIIIKNYKLVKKIKKIPNIIYLYFKTI